MEFAIIFIAAVFVNNILLSQFLGICPFLGVSNKLSTAAGMSMAVCFVITLATVVTFLLNSILVEFELQFLQTISFILVIAALVQMVEIVLKKISPSLYAALGIFLPLITTNCAVLGVALSVVTKYDSLGMATWYAFSTSVGFGLSMVLFAGLREQLSLNNVPKAFKGVPIALVTASVLAMAFMGFSGLVSEQSDDSAPAASGATTSAPVNVTFVQYNVGAFNKSSETGINVIADVVKELCADVVSLNEVDSCTVRTQKVDQLAEFAKVMGEWNYHYGAAMPYDEGAYGVAVASVPDLNIVSKDVLKLPKVDGHEPRALAIVEYDSFVYCSTHLDLTTASQLEQIKAINGYVDSKYKDKPVFIGGDFNCEPDSEPFAYMKESGWKLLTPADKNSFKSSEPVKCIDFIFVRENGRTVKTLETSIPSTLDEADLKTASDHLPVVLSVTIE